MLHQKCEKTRVSNADSCFYIYHREESRARKAPPVILIGHVTAGVNNDVVFKKTNYFDAKCFFEEAQRNI